MKKEKDKEVKSVSKEENAENDDKKVSQKKKDEQ